MFTVVARAYSSYLGYPDYTDTLEQAYALAHELMSDNCDSVTIYDSDDPEALPLVTIT